ncbi:hypothetical protein KY289_002722 [Solanum tuberosum]|nr:hypothetical protein KY289_002722 [Solanum tuberosum]
MMGTEDKALFCFCHWGKKNKVLPDGSTSYVGGITRQVIAKTGIKYNDFVNAGFDRLCIDPSDKILHFTVKFDRSQLIQLSDQEDVNTLLQFNDGFAHVYASSFEMEPYSRLPSVGAKKIEPIVVFDVEPDTNPVRDDENDFASSLKKAESDQSAGDSKPQQKEVVDADDQNHASVTMLWINSVKRLNQNGAGLSEGNVQNDCTSNVGTVNEQVSRSPTGGTEKVELIVDSDSESYTSSDSDPPEIMYYYPNTEFSDFDKHKTENCFAVDQIWAVYDTLDFMPRFYAHIRKVSGPEFKIKLRWLEPHPEEDQREECAWITADLPVGCGKFRVGNTYYTNDGVIFSHQVQCVMGVRGMYIVYPRKGETWALFKDWDIRWSSDPENHRNYKYEIVEILSDYVGDIGIQVGYLDKMTEFLSLFQRTKRTEVGIFFVRPKENYKFSHQIPSFKMTGTEREGVPSASFELDPASLPLSADDIWYPGNVKEVRRTINSEPVESVLSAVSTGTSGKFDNAKTSLNSGDLEGIHDESLYSLTWS